MDKEEFMQLILKTIDENGSELSLLDYADALDDLAFDLKTRAESARNDMDTED